MELNQSNYYSTEANKEYSSVSQFKDFMRCEAMALAKIDGTYKQPTTKALLVGSFVDAYFEGTLEQFISDNPAVFTRKNELRSEFRKANEIIARVQADPLFMRFMSGDKQKILTFSMFGVDWKMKMDSYLEDVCITDLKVVANFRTLPYWRYDFQGAVYQKGVEIVCGKQLPFYLAAVTKERVIDLDIFQIPQSTLNLALQEIGENMERFRRVKAGEEPPQYCGKCDYCKSIKAATIRNYNELLEE